MTDIALISPVTPFEPRDGHRLAVLSDVNAILDNKLKLGVISFAYGDENLTVSASCYAESIPAQSGNFGLRLLRGVAKGLPPSAERFYSRATRRAVSDALSKWRPNVVIIDDASVSGFVGIVREILPHAKVILRSHNVMQDVRTEQWQRLRGLSRVPVKFDRDRYTEFEAQAIASCDAHWTITQADALRMEVLYKKPAQCLSVSIPVERYQGIRVEEGQKNGFVHVGTLDYRRRTDLSQFLSRDWPKVLDADGDASLTLAGELKGQNIPARNVTYAGRVTNDADIYSRGRFAINFQSSPGGVKLKSLTSMAAGRTLVSTAEGVEGIEISAGRQYLSLEDFVSNPGLREMLADVRATQPIADAGRQFVNDRHSRSAIATRLSNLLGGF